MTETQSHYTTPGNHNMRIPSRENFNRYAVEILSEHDFCTEYPTGHAVDKVASSLRWTLNNHKYGNRR